MEHPRLRRFSCGWFTTEDLSIFRLCYMGMDQNMSKPIAYHLTVGTSIHQPAILGYLYGHIPAGSTDLCRKIRRSAWWMLYASWSRWAHPNGCRMGWSLAWWMANEWCGSLVWFIFYMEDTGGCHISPKKAGAWPGRSWSWGTPQGGWIISLVTIEFSKSARDSQCGRLEKTVGQWVQWTRKLFCFFSGRIVFSPSDSR